MKCSKHTLNADDVKYIIAFVVVNKLAIGLCTELENGL